MKQFNIVQYYFGLICVCGLLQFTQQQRDSLPIRDNGVLQIDELVSMEQQQHNRKLLDVTQGGNRGLRQTALQYEDVYVQFESIILDDTREPVKNTTLFPYSAVVHINFTCPSQQPERSQCTGTMIGRRTVLTAGHCIKSYQGVGESGEECYDYIVTPGKQGDFEPFGNSKVSKTLLPKNWQTIQDIDKYTFSDYGLLILEKDLGSQTGWMSVSIDCFQTQYPDMVVAGYPADSLYDGKTMVASSCPVQLDACKNNVSDGEFNHTCDTYGGQSGSAMWVINQNGVREVRAVHVRGTRDLQTGQNKGVYVSVDAFLWINASKETR